MSENVALVWHYTVWLDRAERIMAEGVIRPALDSGLNQKRTVCWFSSLPTFEPTARKRIVRNGVVRQQTIAECAESGGGLFRFAIPRATALPWRQCCAVAGISRSEAKELEAMGRKQGGNPSNWYGVLGAVLLADVVSIETYRDGDHWDAFVATAAK